MSGSYERVNANGRSTRARGDGSGYSGWQIFAWVVFGLVAVGVIAGIVALGITLGTNSQSGSGSNDDAVKARLEEIIALDNNETVEWVLSRPPGTPICPAPENENQTIAASHVDVGGGIVPFFSNILPWRIGQDSPNGLPFENGAAVSNTASLKFASIARELAFYAGLDFDTIELDSPRLTVFLKNFEDRGPNNRDKLEYMFALTPDKMALYEDRLDEMFNRIDARIADGMTGVIGVFREELISWFLDIHLGHADHPPLVGEYFSRFSDVVGYVRNPAVDPREDLLFGFNNAEAIREYFRERVASITVSGDRSTLMHHWIIAGLDPESVVTESLHNIVAFVQFANTFFRIVVSAQYAGGMPPDAGEFWFPPPNIPPPLPSYDFFMLYAAAADDNERLDVIREMYRILSPNSNAFSNLDDPLDDRSIQQRHTWQSIMIGSQNTGNPQTDVGKYFTYDPTLYAADFSTSLGNFTEAAPDATIEDLLGYSMIDNDPTYNDGTVVTLQNPKIQPVFATPLYMIFGPSYRRCPGELLNYFVAGKILERFGAYSFAFQPVLDGPCDPVSPDTSRYVALAPRTAVFDNLVINPPSPVILVNP